MEIFKYSNDALDHLRKKDKKLGHAIDRIGIVEREVIPDLFTALVNSIVSQQISAKAASTVWGRLFNTLSEISPQNICSSPLEDLRKCGLSMRKVQYIKNIGETVLNNDLVLTDLYALEDEEIIKRLSSLNGIGRWTAEMLLIFSMQRPDVVSWGDMAIQRGMMNLYGLKSLSKDQFEKYRKRYSPYGSVASLYLWVLSHE